MTQQITWGILATGGIARLFARDLNLNGHRIGAVGSRSLESAQAFAAEFDVAKAYGSYEELCDDPDIDIIYVATPHPMHEDNAILALNAGKHVLVEKAFTLNEDQAQRIADVAAERNLLVLEAMWTRFLPHMARVREILASGVLGTPRSLLATHVQDLPDDPAHRLNDLRLGGGALLDLGIYPVSFAVDLFGLPAEVLATGTLKATGADASVSISLRHENGEVSSLLTASDTAGPCIATIHCTEGYIVIDHVFYTPTGFNVYRADGERVETYHSDVVGRGMQYQALEAERLIRAGEISSPLLPVDQSVAIMNVLDEIRRQIGVRYPGE